MRKNISYRQAIIKDYSRIIKMYNNAYSFNRTIADFVWLYDKNPMGKGIVFVATIGDEIIGIIGLVAYQFIVNGEIVLTYKSEDALVDSRYRRQGVFKDLYKLVFHFLENKYLWSFTNRKDIFEKVGRPHLHRLSKAVSVCGIVYPHNLKNQKRKIIKSILYSLSYLKTLIAPKIKNGSHTLLTVEEWKDYGFSSFISSLSRDSPDIYYPLMNQKILQWRLEENPNFETYGIYISKNDDNQIAAMSILGFGKIEVYWLSSYFIKSNIEDKNIAHIISVKEEIFSKENKILYTWLFDTNAEVRNIKKLFLKSGFSITNKGMWIGKSPEPNLINGRNIYYSAQLGIR